MKTTHRFSIPLLIGISSVMAHAQEAAKVVYVQGDVQIVRANKTLTPQKGDALQVGDQIQTGTGKLQLKFVDGAVMALNPQSKFQIDRYHYNPNQPSESVAHTHLIQGGLRTVTGAVAKVNKPGYQLETATGVIGVRGTEIAVSGGQVFTVMGVVSHCSNNPTNAESKTCLEPNQVLLPAGTSIEKKQAATGQNTGDDESAAQAAYVVAQTKPVIDLLVGGPAINQSVRPSSIDIPAAKEIQVTTDRPYTLKPTPTTPTTPSVVSNTVSGTALLAGDSFTSPNSYTYAFTSGSATFERFSNETSAQDRLVSINAAVSANTTNPNQYNLSSTDSTLLGQSSDQLLSWGTWKASTTTSNLPLFSSQPTSSIYWLYGQNPVVPPANGTLNYTSVGYAGELSVNGITSSLNSLTSTLSLDLSNSTVAMNTTMSSTNGYTASFNNTASPSAFSSISNGVMSFGNLRGTLTGNATPKNTGLYLDGSIQLFGSGSQPNNAGMSFALRQNEFSSYTVDGRGVVAYKK